MSELIQCDGCQVQGKAEGVMDWLRLERFGIDAGHLGRSSGPWHFHGVDCLALWAAGRAHQARTLGVHPG